MHPAASKFARFLGVSLFIVAGIALMRDTAAQGQDFVVFWEAARSVLSGGSPYRLNGSGGMVFKYPPWVLPLFFPFVFLPLSLAKWFWAFTEIFSLGAVFYHLKKMGVRTGALLVLVLLYWGIWVVHALDGQIELLLLALVLWAARKRGNRFAFVLMVWALSVKVFTLFALFGMDRRNFGLKNGVLLLVVFLILSLPALYCSPQYSSKALLSDWVAAANSGGEQLVGEKIRGRENQGFPALVMRVAKTPAQDDKKDLYWFFVLAVTLGVLWWRLSLNLSFESRFFGGLGLAVTAHPLAWVHLFFFPFPLAGIVFQQFLIRDLRKSRVTLLWGAGLVCLTLISRKTFGEVGLWLELASIRSWGVLGLCGSLVLLNKRGRQETL